MTIDEAKEAVKNRATVWYKGVPWIANGIISWYQHTGYGIGWRNSIDLVPMNGSRSCTQALVSECSLEVKAADERSRG